ncbi:MAG: ATP-dependent DNA helicase RecG [Pseudomonadota bacterium]|nr:ATP-dependent DNA helicase RecG [Pseudomonadota bacterium]
MRPPILNPIFAPVQSLPGIGPRLAKLVERVTGPLVADLLWHLPAGLVDRRRVTDIAGAPDGQTVTLIVRVDGHAPGRSRNQPYRIRCTDQTGLMEIVYFHPREDWLQKQFPQGKKVVVSGRVERFNGQLQMPHPDLAGAPEELASIAVVEPVYSLTAGLMPRVLRKAVAGAVARAPDLPEWQDLAWLRREGFPPWKLAVTQVHAPEDEKALLPETPARRRLAFDELLANQLALGLVRRRQKELPGHAIRGDGHLRERFRAALPWTLTGGQSQALEEIGTDMASGGRMLRLLQGDVGSGKTVVAFLAMLNAIEAGYQTVLMAPTEILARQHLQTFTPWAQQLGLRVDILTGREKGKTRTELLERLATGETSLVIGTHALFQDPVQFRRLGLAVIDEQHRFGVHQRLQLSAKGAREGAGAADLLVMTATPIPRTLALTAWGDMDISRIPEKPPGRKPIDTRLVALDRLDEVVGALKRKIVTGDQVYWVCPLVDESEATDLAAATERQAFLRGALGEQVGLVHGQMKGPDKDRVMAAFAAGELDVLVATTVIEVGVDVPRATIMVVEHAERFGLAQLHQLRGRVGRGSGASSCLLLYDPKLSETARSRLKIMRETEDGFRIAEEDLRLRGAGEILGTRQSGLQEFRLASLAAHGDLLHAAHDDARLVLERDPQLETDRGKTLRILLYLFRQDDGIRYLRSG